MVLFIGFPALLVFSSLAMEQQALTADTPEDFFLVKKESVKVNLTKKAPIDLYGDPLPTDAVARMGTVRLRHHDGILCLALSPNGKMAASVGGSLQYNPRQAIRLWDTATGKQIWELLGHPSVPALVAFSPDGQILASSSGRLSPLGLVDDVICIWQVATGKKLHVIIEPINREAAGPSELPVAFSSDSKVLAVINRENKIRLWNLESGKEIRQWDAEAGNMTLVFSPKGKVIASMGSGVILFWDVATGKRIQKIEVKETAERYLQHALFFTPDGKEVIVRAKGTVWWNWEKGIHVRDIPGDILARSACGQYLAVSEEKDIAIWDCEKGKELKRWPRRGEFMLHPYGASIQGGISNDGRLLIAPGWQAIRCMNTETGKLLHERTAHWRGIVFVAFSPDDRNLISAGDRVVRIWETKTGKPVDVFKGHSGFIFGGDITSDGKMLATASGDGTARLWDIGAREEKARFPIGLPGPCRVAFSPDRKGLMTASLTGGEKRPARIWDIPTGKERCRFGPGRSLAPVFLPDGKRVIHRRSGAISIMDANSGMELRSFMLASHNGDTGLVLSRDSRIAVTGHPESLDSNDPRDVSLWEMASGTMIGKFEGHKAGVAALAMSRDGKLLASGSWDGTVRI